LRASPDFRAPQNAADFLTRDLRPPVDAARTATANQAPSESAEQPRPRPIGVSGPSFLGLSHDNSPEPVDEEHPPSHLRRNIGLAVLAAAAVLAVIQWRSLRDVGVAYLRGESSSLAPAHSSTPNPSPAVATVNSGAESTASAPAGAAKPVESSSAAGHEPPGSAAQNAPASQSPTTAKEVASANVTKSVAPKQDATTPPAIAMATEPIAATTPKRELEARRVAPPGADEMNRAARAGDPAARATWLWRAVGKGNVQAAVELAMMYEQGSGVARDCDEARMLLHSAVNRGSTEAKARLLTLLRDGCR
jgi:TPR repeat protein